VNHPAVGPLSIVDLAERALRASGNGLNRESAAHLVTQWRYYGDLSAEDVTAVLDRFGPAPS
jgi:hypothetical protein